MTEEERQSSKILVYQVLPSRYGLNPDDLRRADALEVVIGQGAKPGGGGMLLGQKITERVADGSLAGQRAVEPYPRIRPPFGSNSGAVRRRAGRGSPTISMQ